MYGWFSNKQRELGGTVWYSAPDGSEVEVTMVTKTSKHNTGHADMACVGEVVKYLRKGERGIFR